MERPLSVASLVHRATASRFLTRFSRLLGTLQLPLPVSPPAPGERLWLDEADFEAQVTKRTVDPFLRHHARNLSRDGVTHLPGAIPTSLCDEVVADFHRYCASHQAASAAFADQHGHHSRLCNFHVASSAAMRVAMDPMICRLLDFLFGRRSAVLSSLTFEKGSQQAIHRDGPYFRSEPEGFFFGVWTALEDVSEQAGPLVYARAGHRVPVSPLEAASRHAAERPAVDLGTFYNQRVEEACRARNLELASQIMRRGDVLIWHPELPHGGKPIVEPGRTRKSLVVHSAPQGTCTYGPDVFFGAKPVPFAPRYLEAFGRCYVDQGYAQFMENH